MLLNQRWPWFDETLLILKSFWSVSTCWYALLDSGVEKTVALKTQLVHVSIRGLRTSLVLVTHFHSIILEKADCTVFLWCEEYQCCLLCPNRLDYCLCKHLVDFCIFDLCPRPTSALPSRMDRCGSIFKENYPSFCQIYLAMVALHHGLLLSEHSFDAFSSLCWFVIELDFILPVIESFLNVFFLGHSVAQNYLFSDF